MNIRRITTANQIHLENETVLVLGYFDGLHLGHQELFKKARQIADKKGLKVALLTFPESPKLALFATNQNCCSICKVLRIGSKN